MFLIHLLVIPLQASGKLSILHKNIHVEHVWFAWQSRSIGTKRVFPFSEWLHRILHLSCREIWLRVTNTSAVLSVKVENTQSISLLCYIPELIVTSIKLQVAMTCLSTSLFVSGINPTIVGGMWTNVNTINLIKSIIFCGFKVRGLYGVFASLEGWQNVLI